MAETPLPVLMKEIGEALKLDNDGNEKEAYKKYVGCTYRISTNLILAIRSTSGDVVVTSKTSRQVKLAQQCIDRMVALMEKMDLNTSGSSASTPVTSPTSVTSFPQPQSPASPHKLPTPSRSTVSQGASITPAGESIKGSVSTVKASTPVSQETNNNYRGLGRPVPSLPDEYNPHSFHATKPRSLTPMEIAQRQNQSLMAAYKARMNRLNRSDFNAFSYSLTIQRKMAENLAIAQAQEEELARKMQARNQRLEEEAAKRFAQATPMGMSKEEQEQRQIYKRILEYENEAKWLRNWRKRLEANPEDAVLISQLVQEVLRCSDHPITELLRKYQFKVYEKLYPLVANKHVDLELVTVPLREDLWPSNEEMEEHLRSSRGSSVSMSPEGSEKKSDEKDPRQMSSPRDDGKGGAQGRVEDTEGHAASNNEESKDKNRVQSDKSAKEEEVENRLYNDVQESKSQSVESAAASGPVSWDDPLSVRSKSETSSKSSVPCSSDTEDDSVGKVNNSDEILVEEKSPDEKVPSDNGTSSSEGEKRKDAGGEDNETQKSNSDVSENTQAEKASAKEVEECCDSGSDSDESVFDSKETGDGEKEKEDPSSNVETAVSRTKKDLHLALEKGERLESQLSWERKQAQLLMRQVTRDYENYNEENFDDLFEDDEEGNNEKETALGGDGNAEKRKDMRSTGVLSNPTTTFNQDPKLVKSKSEDKHSPSFDRSQSHQPRANQLSMDNDAAVFQSLPANVNRSSDPVVSKKLAKLSVDAYKRHLKSISDDILNFLDKLLVMMTIAYEPLDTPVGRDQCAVSLEEPFFKPIWKTLLRMFSRLFQGG
ncbi:VPS9 domain-containing protein 1 isoform X2 [Aplysia californica]|uniref:VPS9 domain-containing protein 1 isoform X2 n=1 Tax=Aplysia californica TaxID=6500 RepID=A0ABM1A6I6_APLCA|nr:VPS9 domain-containing protein 1 isoform X2 [Aplysia californica]